MFPYRENTDRLSKVGGGFSKMLSSLTPDIALLEKKDRPSTKARPNEKLSLSDLRKGLTTA
jgi:hypothetical protein